LPIGCRNRPGEAPPSTAAAPPDRESRSRPAQSAGRALPPRRQHHLDADREQLAFISGRLEANFCAQVQLAKPKLPHSRFSGDGWCRQDAGSRLQQRHDLDGTFCQPGLLLCRREQFTNPADLLRGVSLGQTDSRHGRADDRMQVVGGQVVGRDGIEPPTFAVFSRVAAIQSIRDRSSEPDRRCSAG
jgi:hypothetical protein